MSCPLFKLPLFFLCNNGHYIYIERELESETEWERCIFPRVCFLWFVFVSLVMQREGGEVFKDLGLILKSPSLSFLHSIRLSPPLVLHCRRVCHATWDGQILDGHTRVLHLFSDSVLTDSNNVDACPHNTNTHQYPRPTPWAAPEPQRPWRSGFGERVWMGRPVSGLYKNPSVPYAKQSAVVFFPCGLSVLPRQ